MTDKTLTDELAEALEMAAYRFVSDEHGDAVAYEMSENGWQWPDGIRHVHAGTEKICAVLRKYNAAKAEASP